jgi:hypothetical protein
LESKCNTFESKVLDPQKLSGSQAKEIKKLKLQVHTLKGKEGSRPTQFKRLKKGGTMLI